MRDAAETYRTIGEYFGVTSERARRMVLSHRKREQKIVKGGDDDLLAKLLCTDCDTGRIEHFLFNAGYTWDVDEIVARGGKQLMTVKKLGQKSIMKIAKALEEMGKIESAEKWISS